MADDTVFQSISNEELKRALENGFDIAGTLVDDPVTREGYSQITKEDYETSASDYGRALAVGTLGIGSGVARLSQYATDGAIGGDTAKYLEGLSDEQVRAMSPAARRALGAAFLPDEGEESVLDAGLGRSLALKTTAAVPSLVASIIPAGIATTLLRGASLGVRAGVGAGVARGTAGVLNAGDVVGQIYKKIDEFSDEELAQESDVFAGYLTMMSPEEARARYMRDVAGVAPIVAGAISAALGGVEAQVARRLGGEAAKGVLKGAGKGALAEMIQEGAETGSGELLSQSALAEAGLDDLSWTKILSQTIEGMAVGGVMGGVAGGIGGVGGRTRKEPEPKIQQTDAGPLDQTTAAAMTADQQTPPAAPQTPPAAPVTPEVTAAAAPAAAPAPKKLGYWVEQVGEMANRAGINIEEEERADLEKRVAEILNANKNTAQRWAGIRQIVDELKAQKAPAPVAPAANPDRDAMVEGIKVLDQQTPPVPEPKSWLEKQVEMLSLGQRDAVLIPLSTPNKERPRKPSKFDSVVVKEGLVYFNPGILTKGQVKKASKEGRLNQILPYGPTSNVEAVADVAQGAEPRMVQVVKDGIPVAEAVSSTATVEQDAAAMAAKAPVGAELVVRSDVDQAIQERADARAAENAKAPRTGRILEAVTNKANQKAVNKKLAQNIKKATEPPKAPRTFKDNEEKAKREADNTAAKELFQKWVPETTSFPQTAEERQALFNRLDGILKEAKERGIKILDKSLGDTVSGELAYLTEVRALRNEMKTKKKEVSDDRILTFLGRELGIKKGEVDEVKSERRSEGEMANRQDQGDVEAKADLTEDATPEDALIAKQEAEEETVLRDEKEVVETARERESIFDRTRREALERNKEKIDKIRALAKDPAATEGERAAAQDAIRRIEEGGSADLIEKIVAASVVKGENKEGKFKVESRRKIEGLKPKVEGKISLTKKSEPAKDEPFVSQVQVIDYRGSKRISFGSLLFGYTQIRGFGGGYQLIIDRIDGQPIGYFRGSPLSQASIDMRRDPRGGFSPETLNETTIPETFHPLITEFVSGKIDRDGLLEGLRKIERETVEYVKSKERTAKAEQPVRATIMPGQQEFTTLAEVIDADPNNLELIRELALEDDMLVTRSGQEITPTAVSDVRSLFRAGMSDTDIKDPMMRQLLPFLRRELLRMVGDVKVMVVSPEQMAQLSEKPNTGGFYTRYGTEDVIVIREDGVANPKILTYLMTHEAIHAATTRGLDSNREFFDTLKAVADEVRAAMPEVAEMYGFTDQYEFVAELANPDFVEVLSKVTVSPELAQKLGLKDWEKRTVWNVVVEAIRNLLKLPTESFSALDAVMRTTAQAMEAQTQLPESFRALPRGAFPQFAAMDVAKQAAQSLQDKGPSSISKRKALLSLSTLDQIRQWYRGTFVNEKGQDILENMISSIQRIRPFADDKRERGEKLAQRFMDFARANPEAANEFADIANSTTMLNAQLFGDNAHWGENRRDSWQARALLPDLQRRFAAVQNQNSEARQLYEDMVAYYRDTQNEITRQLVDNILAEHDAALSEADRASLTYKVMRGTLDDAARKLLNNDTIFNALNDARQLRLIEGDYFPLMRHGEFVVQTKDSIGDLMGGVEVEPGVVEFTAKSNGDALKAAEAFAKRTTKGQGFSKEDGVPLVMSGPTAVEMPSDSTQYKYRVKVQLDGVHMFDTQAEAESFIRDQKGSFAKISAAPLLKRDDGNYGEGFNNSSLAAIAKSISARENIPQAQREMMLTALKQAAVRHMAGNRVQKRSLPRRGFVGASSDMARNTLVYAEASTRYLAKLRYMPLVREAFTDMQKAVDAAKYSADHQMMEQVLNHMRKRVDGNVIGEQEASPFVRDVMTLSYIDKLFSPAYSLLQMMQPTMMTLPYLGGRYGTGNAGAAIARAYRDIGAGEAFGGGLRNTKQALLQFTKTAIDSSDVIGSILKNVGNQSDGKALTALINELAERGAIDKNAGMEVAEVVTKGRGNWAMGLSKVDRIARQLPASIEQVNRAVTAIAAYRLAIQNGTSPEKAMSMAFDAVMNTQGDYSASNAPSVFNHPIWRISLQFKKYAQMYYAMFGDILYRSFKDASPEERKVARKQLAQLMAVQVLAAGALGVPGMEVIKIGVMAASALGLGGGYDDFEREVREAAAGIFGKYAGELLTKGVIPRAIGIDLSTRLGADSLLTFGEPKKYDETNVGAYLLNTFIGAPGSLIADQFKAARGFADAIKQGDGSQAWKAAELLPMPKFIADTAKAARKAIEGQTSSKSGRQTEEPIGLGTAALNAVGLRTAEQAERGAAKGAGIAESERRREDQGTMSKLKTQFAEAKNEGERVRVLNRLKELNARLPEDMRQTPAQLRAFAKRYKQDQAKGLIKDGARFRNEADRAASERAGSIYNYAR